ncbi:MAG: SDR family oxidoreductase [Rhodobacterales bacterium]|nr:SDR family oxidoreductase [Rhodobacterales bacterium]
MTVRVLVTGAGGFIGGHVVAALRAAGHTVRRGLRRAAPADPESVACDFGADTDPAAWAPRLAGIDAVVNAAGILREGGGVTFDAAHRGVPAALFTACQRAGVRRVVQVSAIGDPDATAFIGTKHAGDADLLGRDLDGVVVRPSLVWSPAGSYGGNSLIRALAALPWVMPLSGGGGQRLQPIAAEDLARVVVALVEGRSTGVVEAVGPDTVTFADLLARLRAWMGFRPARPLSLPNGLTGALAGLADLFVRGPFGTTMHRMLMTDNVGAPGADQALRDATDVAPRPLDAVLAAHPSHVQDRWHARLYLLRPLLRLALAVLWIASGLVGLVLLARGTGDALALVLGWPAGLTGGLILGLSVLDLVLGGLLLFRRWVVPVGALMVLSTVGYTAVIGLAAPEMWLAPLGGLIKNIPLVPALLVMMAIEDPR